VGRGKGRPFEKRFCAGNDQLGRPGRGMRPRKGQSKWFDSETTEFLSSGGGGAGVQNPNSNGWGERGRRDSILTERRVFAKLVIDKGGWHTDQGSGTVERVSKNTWGARSKCGIARQGTDHEQPGSGDPVDFPTRGGGVGVKTEKEKTTQNKRRWERAETVGNAIRPHR